MARIVITTFGSFGDVNPYIGLGLELQRRGHHPVLAMPGIFREPVEREGLAFAAVRPDLDPDDAGLTARIMDSARGPETLFTELLVPQLQASYDDLDAAAEGADLIVTHPASMVGPILAQKRKLPWASSVLAPLSFFSVSDPMVPPPAPWLHPLLVRSRAASRAFGWMSDRITRRWVAPVQRFRAALGLPEGANPVLAGQHSPQLVLALFSRVLADPQPDWPAHTVVAGPILFNGAATPEASAELERFLSEGDPPIVFTLGTSAVEAADRSTTSAPKLPAASREGRCCWSVVMPAIARAPPGRTCWPWTTRHTRRCSRGRRRLFIRAAPARCTRPCSRAGPRWWCRTRTISRTTRTGWSGWASLGRFIQPATRCRRSSGRSASCWLTSTSQRAHARWGR